MSCCCYCFIFSENEKESARFVDQNCRHVKKVSIFSQEIKLMPLIISKGKYLFHTVPYLIKYQFVSKSPSFPFNSKVWLRIGERTIPRAMHFQVSSSRTIRGSHLLTEPPLDTSVNWEYTTESWKRLMFLVSTQ